MLGPIKPIPLAFKVFRLLIGPLEPKEPFSDLIGVFFTRILAIFRPSWGGFNDFRASKADTDSLLEPLDYCLDTWSRSNPSRT